MDKRHEQSLLHAMDILGSEYYKDFLKSVYLYGSCARGDRNFIQMLIFFYL